MDVENQTANSGSFSIPEVPAQNRADSLCHHISHFGTVIPKRIFVGGLDEKVSESDLQEVFSLYGAVKDVKIVVDRLGLSKRYGFVTFETQEDVLKILHDGNGIYFKDKKLNVGPAVRKWQGPRHIRSVHLASPGPAFPLPMSSGDLRLMTSTSCPYTHQSGLAYFYCNNMRPPAQPGSSVLHLQTPQPVYQQPAYHPNQYLPNQYQWGGFQQPMPSSPIRSSQQSECRSANVQPPQRGTPNTATEQAVQQVYPVRPQKTEEFDVSITTGPSGAKDPLMYPPQDLSPRSSRATRHLHVYTSKLLM